MLTWICHHMASLGHNELMECGFQGNKYRKTSNISRTLIGNKIIDHSDVVGATPVGAAPTTSSSWHKHMASMDRTKTITRRDEGYLSVGIWLSYIRGLTVVTLVCDYAGPESLFNETEKVSHLRYMIHMLWLNIVMSARVSQITSNSTVQQLVEANLNDNIRGPCYWPFEGGIHRFPLTKGQ